MRLAVSLAIMTSVLLSGCCTTRKSAVGDRTRFVGFKNFSRFTQTPGAAPGEVVFTSPEIAAPINWNELIVSWNATPESYVKIEARGIYSDHATKFYTLGLWSENPAQHARESVVRQRDDDGTVKTDTLVLSRPGASVQLRITAGGTGEKGVSPLKFLGLSFCDGKAQPASAPSTHLAWGRTLDVPERRQGEYEGGGGWCSPTSLSMVLAYWSGQLHRPELNHTVPEVAAAINDPVFDGTGNWPFNTAYAGSFSGLRAYVTRLNDVSELENWIAAGVPVIISVSSYLTNNRSSGPDNGHLIVCAGFTENGDVVVNDPGVSVKRNQRARRVYPRERLANAWKKSKNAVYLVYPENISVPKSGSGNWE
jgi:hypothetical protein